MDFEIHYIIFGSVSSRLVFSKSTDLEDVIKSIAGMDAEGVQLVNIGLTDAIENSQLLPIVDEKAGLLNANVTNDPTENTGKARSTIDVDACQLNTCENLGKCTDLDGIDVSAAGRSCDCSLTGFTGSSCDENINECDSSPCENSFSCIDAC